MDVWCKQGCVGSQLITPQFQPTFQGMLNVASGQYDPGKHRTSNTPIELCGGNYSPLQRPQEPMQAKLLQYCALCGMTLNTKSMRSLSALLLHNMYMLQNCSSAIINSIGNIIQALYKALFVIWDELEQLILGMWRSQVARNTLWGPELIRIQINPSVRARGERTLWWMLLFMAIVLQFHIPLSTDIFV
jgi:hypothetical protein